MPARVPEPEKQIAKSMPRFRNTALSSTKRRKAGLKVIRFFSKYFPHKILIICYSYFP